ncbi:hypothetical protein ACP70R_027432 [Stipagrostis hirtigluma subsp. patula]
MAAPALNSLAVAFLLALAVVAAGAARTTTTAPAPDSDDTPQDRPCHSHNGWSDHLCKDVCGASGFAAYEYTVPNAAVGGLARCCCCPIKGIGSCVSVQA